MISTLNCSKGLSAELTKAYGQETLDLNDGSLSVKVSGPADTEAYEVWLIDNHPGRGRSVESEPGDSMFRIGTLNHEGGSAKLKANLDLVALGDFKIDLVAVEKAGLNPGNGSLGSLQCLGT